MNERLDEQERRKDRKKEKRGTVKYGSNEHAFNENSSVKK